MKIRAEAVYTPEGWAQDHVLETDTSGLILSLAPFTNQTIDQSLSGYLVPGWVNAHCHLELSALRGDIPRGTGMAGFVKALFKARAAYSEPELMEAARMGLQEARQTGTAAIGDISNMALTAAPKRAPRVPYTHTFIEVLGMLESQAESRLEAGKKVAEAFLGLSHSLSPHAPYSVSALLFKKLYHTPGPFSLHLMESEQEVQLFATNDGPLVEFYREIGLPFSPFEASDPLTHVLKELPADAPILFVHNVQLSPEEIAHLHARFPKAWFVLCPRTNRYIHSQLPDIEGFAKAGDRYCLGTDSLASNDSLDMWEEVKLALTHAEGLDLHRAVKWATTNGANALGVGDRFGAFGEYSRPGIIHLTDSDWQEAEVNVLFPAP